MKTRIFTAIIAFALFVPVLYFSSTIVFPIVLALLSVVSIYELSECTGMKKCYAMVVPFYLMAVAVPFVIRFYKHPNRFFTVFLFGILVGVLYCFGTLVFCRDKFHFADVFVFFATGCYILAGLNSILFVRGYFYGGNYLFLLPFIGAWITDTFAYLGGRLFGKHKLISDVSPNKTVEGAIIGTVFSMLFTILFFIFANANGLWSAFDYDYILISATGLLLAVVSQFGDLGMSLIKRHYGIKDFGKIFPGHGGVLDRFDSVIATGLLTLTICMAITFI